MEVVIALGVIAVAVPLFLSMSKSAGDARLLAEADTRSAWLAKEVKREVTAAWSDPVRDSVFGRQLPFPDFANESAPEVLAFDFEGNFLATGDQTDLSGPSAIANAAYLVTVFGAGYDPNVPSPPDSDLSLLRIQVFHPAKAKPETRRVFHYRTIRTRSDIP